MESGHTTVNHFTSLMSTLNAQRQSQEFCDLAFVVEGQTFPVHSSIFAACSPQMKTLLEVLPSSSITMHVQLNDVPVSGFAPLLELMYTGQLQLERDCLDDIRQTVECLGMDEFVKKNCPGLLLHQSHNQVENTFLSGQENQRHSSINDHIHPDQKNTNDLIGGHDYHMAQLETECFIGEESHDVNKNITVASRKGHVDTGKAEIDTSTHASLIKALTNKEASSANEQNTLDNSIVNNTDNMAMINTTTADWDKMKDKFIGEEKDFSRVLPQRDQGINAIKIPTQHKHRLISPIGNPENSLGASDDSSDRQYELMFTNRSQESDIDTDIISLSSPSLQSVNLPRDSGNHLDLTVSLPRLNTIASPCHIDDESVFTFAFPPSLSGDVSHTFIHNDGRQISSGMEKGGTEIRTDAEMNAVTSNSGTLSSIQACIEDFNPVGIFENRSVQNKMQTSCGSEFLDSHNMDHSYSVANGEFSIPCLMSEVEIVNSGTQVQIHHDVTMVTQTDMEDLLMVSLDQIENGEMWSNRHEEDVTVSNGQDKDHCEKEEKGTEVRSIMADSQQVICSHICDESCQPQCILSALSQNSNGKSKSLEHHEHAKHFTTQTKKKEKSKVLHVLQNLKSDVKQKCKAVLNGNKKTRKYVINPKQASSKRTNITAIKVVETDFLHSGEIGDKTIAQSGQSNLQTLNSSNKCKENKINESTVNQCKVSNQCYICQVTVPHVKDLIWHFRLEHKGMKPYQCEECHELFSRSDNMKEHILRAHNGGKVFSCKICGCNFARAAYLKTHMRSHSGERPYYCEICGLSFTQKHVLTTHKLKHTDEKPYSCAECGDSFRSRDKLNKHMRIHSDNMKFCCHVCGKQFRQDSSLKFHLKNHAGDRKHQCSYCDKSFVCMSNLKVHMVVHTGQKFSCPFCDKTYTQKPKLKKHLSTHHAHLSEFKETTTSAQVLAQYDFDQNL